MDCRSSKCREAIAGKVRFRERGSLHFSLIHLVYPDRQVATLNRGAHYFVTVMSLLCNRYVLGVGENM